MDSRADAEHGSGECTQEVDGLDIHLEEPLCPPVPVHFFEQSFPLSPMFIHFLPQLHCLPLQIRGDRQTENLLTGVQWVVILGFSRWQWQGASILKCWVDGVDWVDGAQ